MIVLVMAGIAACGIVLVELAWQRTNRSEDSRD